MIVIETSALIAIIEDEPEKARFLQVIADDGSARMSAVSLLEAGMVVRSRRGEKGIDQLYSLLLAMHIMIVPFDEANARAAILAFDKYGKGMGTAAKLNLGDCASYALAKMLNVPLLFKGDDFKATDIFAAV